MKKYTLLLLISLIFCMGCKKDGDGTGTNTSSSLTGKKWKLDSYQNFNDNTDTWDEVKKSDLDLIVEFAANGDMIYYSEGQLFEKRKYKYKDGIISMTYLYKDQEVTSNIAVDKLSSTELNITGTFITYFGDKQFYKAQ